MDSKQEIILYSGNILNKTISLRKGNESNEDEVFESLKSCVSSKLDLANGSNDSVNGNIIEIFAEEETNSSHDMGDRQDLKVTVKLFLYSLERTDIVAAIDRGLKSTSVNYLDNIILSISGFSKPGALTIDHIQKAWTVLEEQVSNGRVRMIGLSDIDTQLFIKMHDIAAIKPGIVQINLASCCVVPPELSEFCKEKGIQLLTHSDPINILPDEKVLEVENLIKENVPLCKELTSWKAMWVMRFQVHLKTRGVLATKGYVASLAGDL